MTFLLDWELTMKCNLDCSYCSSELYGGHDNSTRHPPLDECLKSINFMFEYVDLYMSTKPKGLRYVVLNVYGGESLYHPDIVTVLEQVHEKYKSYQDRWHLTVTTTTNAIISENQLKKIIPLIDEFTVSYHTEATDRQKQQFYNNLLTIKKSGKRQKCIVLMHNRADMFADSKQMIVWLEQNNIRYLPRQLDGNHDYDSAQITWFGKLDQTLTFGNAVPQTTSSRACCGGRQICADQNYKQRHHYIGNQFPNWYCSVNHFFLYIKQVTGEIFVNKDCKMNFEGSVGAIGTLESTEKLLTETKMSIINKTLPIIQCKKSKCLCGLCAPKAQQFEDYNTTMKKYQSL